MTQDHTPWSQFSPFFRASWTSGGQWVNSLHRAVRGPVLKEVSEPQVGLGEWGEAGQWIWWKWSETQVEGLEGLGRPADEDDGRRGGRDGRREDGGERRHQADWRWVVCQVVERLSGRWWSCATCEYLMPASCWTGASSKYCQWIPFVASCGLLNHAWQVSTIADFSSLLPI